MSLPSNPPSFVETTIGIDSQRAQSICARWIATCQASGIRGETIFPQLGAEPWEKMLMLEEEERKLFISTTYKNNDKEPSASCQSVLAILVVVSQIAVYQTYATLFVRRE